MRKTSILLLILQTIHVQSWSMQPPKMDHQTSKSSTISRRGLMDTVSIAAGSVFLNTVLNPSSAIAASSSGGVSLEDLQRIQKGHARVMYLLNNWDAITESCGKNGVDKQVVRTDQQYGGICEKNPLVVQEYLGYKSTLDPLFKIDKVMVKAANTKFVDPDVMEDYLDAVERYREKADMGSMMAYTSSWGEANPNGGKDIIEEYLLSTRSEVEQTEALLKSILQYLKLDVLPPSKAI